MRKWQIVAAMTMAAGWLLAAAGCAAPCGLADGGASYLAGPARFHAVPLRDVLAPLPAAPSPPLNAAEPQHSPQVEQPPVPRRFDDSETPPMPLAPTPPAGLIHPGESSQGLIPIIR